jgi:carbamoyl-phosphate synthase large subunit
VKTVFVTGVGTLLGQGILRSLRLSDRPLRIVTADPDARAAGHWLGDAATVIPPLIDPAYLPVVEGVLVREKVDLVLVGTDVELGTFAAARERLERAHGVHVLVSSPEVVEIADDKWLTTRFLAAHGLPAPRTALASDPEAVRRLVDEVGLPLFAKPRRGARSVGARIVETREALASACEKEPALIVQEFLPEQAGEYTAGSLVVDGRCEGVVVLRRDLRLGNTYRAYREPGCSAFDPFVVRVTEALGAYGPCNLQFRIREGEPVPFEINARFSGTTPVRAIFGFNEVAAIVDHVLDGKPIPTPQLREGIVLRTTGDLLVDAAQVEILRGASRLDTPRAEDIPFATPLRSR